MQIQTLNKKTAFRKVLMICLSVLVNISFLISQELNYPLKKINGIECYVYTVKPAEGFYRIGKNFDTTEAIIKSFNPQAVEGLKAGMQIYIPVKTSSTPGISYIEHVVEKKQTIFRIRKMYKITEDELLEYNPQIKDRPIRVGETLKIPVRKEKEKNVQSLKDNEKTVNSEKKQNKEPQKASNGLLEIFQTPKPDTLDIAFLLPFMLDQKAEIQDNRFIEFYAGALVAIQKAKKQGINFNIYTFDVEKSDLKLMETLQNDAFKKIDLIVGPAYSNQVSMIGDFARIHKIKTLIPFTSKVYDLETNPYIYQFNPGPDIELSKLQEIIKNKIKNSNFLFADLPYVNSSNDDGFVLSGQLKDFMRNNHLDFQTVLFDQDYLQNLHKAINPSVENILIFNTGKLSNLNVYIKNITAMSDTINLTIYEPYAWRTSKIKRPRAFYLSAFKNDFASTAYESYTKDFDLLFDWTPSSESPRYDLLGYDLLNYFIQYVLKKDPTIPISYVLHEGIQSDLKFERSTVKGGFINKTLKQFE
ncbi:MAG: LysM domain-containing protein [Paludibacter sp.]|nr:LysM domain-containing protein [Paludibacter sp.]